MFGFWSYLIKWENPAKAKLWTPKLTKAVDFENMTTMLVVYLTPWKFILKPLKFENGNCRVVGAICQNNFALPGRKAFWLAFQSGINKITKLLTSLICALNLYFAQKLLRKTKNCSRLIEAQKDAPNAKSCSKVAKHNRDRPTHRIVFVPTQKVSGMVLPAWHLAVLILRTHYPSGRTWANIL